MTAILAVNSYPIEWVHRVLPKIREARLLDPAFVRSLDLGRLTVLLFAAGYERGRLTSMFAGRLQSLMAAIEDSELDCLEGYLDNGQGKDAIKALTKVSGIGPRVARNAWFLLVSNHKPIAPPPDVAAPPTNARMSPKGVFYLVLQPGKGGGKPRSTDVVKVNYTGWTTDGRMFDSSVICGEPFEFALTGAIPGLREGLQRIAVGDQARFWIPQELAYQGVESEPKGMLVFDIELLEIRQK